MEHKMENCKRGHLYIDINSYNLSHTYTIRHISLSTEDDIERTVQIHNFFVVYEFHLQLFDGKHFDIMYKFVHYLIVNNRRV